MPEHISKISFPLSAEFWAGMVGKYVYVCKSRGMGEGVCLGGSEKGIGKGVNLGMFER